MLSPSQREALRGVARASVACGLREGRALSVEPAAFDPPLREPRASFVTLRRAGALRGCTGSLEVVRPLVCDVARSAWRAANEDPRFPPVLADELGALEIHVAVLGPLEALPVTSEEELLRRLRPGVDGLVLHDGAATGTFLPAVWDALPSPADFVRELKVKAGLAADHWSDDLRLERYTVEEF